MSRRSSRHSKDAGFTLAEVIVTMFLISMMCLSVFVGLRQITRTMLSVAVRSEAYHLMQAEAERLLASDISSFVASSAQTISSSVKTTYLPTQKTKKLQLSGDNSAGRINFTRRVVAAESTATSRTLRVEVQWTWEGRTQVISTPLYRLIQ